MSTLQAVWNQVEAMLTAGISVIPVRDREVIHHGKILKPKVPYTGWKTFQTQIITKEQLWHDLEEFNTAAVAMVCGKVSGNLEAIDIDVKYQVGIDAQLFQAIANMYPHIGKRLRVHKSPSGGYHLLYRVSEGEIPGNAQLACRSANDEELSVSPKRKKIAFIETRGEGGYIMCPPSFNYQLLRNPEIPTLTWSERCSLIELCRTFNLYIKPEAPPFVPKQADEYYEEDPWTDYSKRVDPVSLLESFGWARVSSQGSGGDKLYFTRPGGTAGDTHGTFSQSKRTFYVYSSNTGLDSDRAYNLGTLLAHYQFGGDKKRTYQHLVDYGYGRIRAKVEARIVKTKAQKDKGMPANASPEAREAYQEEVAQVQVKFPYGVFWARDDEDKMRISREGLYHVADGLGFRVYEQKVVQIIGLFIHERTERQFFDTIKAYIQDDDPEEYEEILNTYEAFLQKSGSFTLTRIPLLDEGAILSDTADTCYKHFQNGYLTIQASGYVFTLWDSKSTSLIWFKEVLPREYQIKAPASCKYKEFLRNATRYDLNPDYFHRIIGYLAHNYKDSTTGYIIVLTEECPDPKQGGGSGKNIWSTLFAHTTTFKNLPGSQIKTDERFLQAWNGEHILAISDVPKSFDFLFLKEPSTGSGIVKKLFKDEREVSCRQMPKFIIQTNYSYEITDGGLKRRIIPIEFTDFFTKTGGVDVHFGCYFPDGWTQSDWAGFDHFVAASIQAWISGGLKLKAQILSGTGWQKQFEHEFGALTYQFIVENWQTWIDKVNVKIGDFNEAYSAFCNENNIQKKYQLTSIKMNSALNVYAKHFNYDFIPNAQHKEMGINYKVKIFTNEAPF